MHPPSSRSSWRRLAPEALSWLVWLCVATVPCPPALRAAPGDGKWTTWSTSWSPPALGTDGTLYVSAGGLFALDALTGKLKWRLDLSVRQPFPPYWLTIVDVDGGAALSADGTVYFGASNGRLYAVNAATGQEKWHFQTGDMVRSTPAISTDGTIVFGSDDGKVYALDGSSGAQRWAFVTEHLPCNSPVIGADGTVYIGSYDRKLYALDVGTGQKKWEFPTGAWVVDSSPAIGADNTIYFGAGDSNVYALDGATGQLRWAFRTGGQVNASPAVGADGTVYIGSNDGQFYALEGATGRKKWAFPTGKSDGPSAALGADGTVYFGTDPGIFYAVDGPTGQARWQSTNFAPVSVNSAPAIGPGGLVYYTLEFPEMLFARESTSVGGLANSPWPKFHGDAANTGQAPVPVGSPRVETLFASQVLLEGAATNLWLRIVANPPAKVQWFQDDAAIPGATNTFLSLASVSATNAGTYTAVVSNPLGVVTTDPVALGVNNVVASNYLGLILSAPQGTALQIETADSVRGPWADLASLTLPASPFVFVDTNRATAGQRFYRTTSADRLGARLCRGWTFTAAAASRYRIDYVEAQLGYTNWQFLTNLTLPQTPYLFVDTTTTNRQPRFYRTTLLP